MGWSWWGSGGVKFPHCPWWNSGLEIEGSFYIAIEPCTRKIQGSNCSPWEKERPKENPLKDEIVFSFEVKKQTRGFLSGHMKGEQGYSLM